MLSSMQAAFSSDSAEATPTENPREAPGGGHDKSQCASETTRALGMQGRSVAEKDEAGIQMQSATTTTDGTMGEMQVDWQWADEVTYIEEEPWTMDLHATWPSYPPGV